MTINRKIIPAQIRALAADEVEVIMSTSALARDGHVLVPSGCDLASYLLNPIVLFAHDPLLPVGNAENIQVQRDQITARVRFAPEGISTKADEVRGLTKAGIIRAVSVGFDPIDGEPLDPSRPRGGQRFTKWQLLELSFVAVPADTGAMVTARAAREGKALSAANATALQQAHDHATRCRDHLAQVLGCAEPDADDVAQRRRAVDALALAQPPLASARAANSAPMNFAQRQADLRRLSRSR